MLIPLTTRKTKGKCQEIKERVCRGF